MSFHDLGHGCESLSEFQLCQLDSHALPQIPKDQHQHQASPPPPMASNLALEPDSRLSTDDLPADCEPTCRRTARLAPGGVGLGPHGSEQHSQARAMRRGIAGGRGGVRAAHHHNLGQRRLQPRNLRPVP